MQRTLFYYTKREEPGVKNPACYETNLNRAPSAAIDVDVESSAVSILASPTPSASAEKKKRGRSVSVPSTCSSSSKINAPAVEACSSKWLAGLLQDSQWQRFLSPVFADNCGQQRFYNIERFLDAERAAGKLILPPAALIFSAFDSVPFDKLKVVLLGQDPYHGIGQAHGLCFSVLPGMRVPPSLQNMYKELTKDVPGFSAPPHGYLQSWAQQGMLMLNATLTVEAHMANSHSHCGWQEFTDDVIQRLSQMHPNRLVFLLWGNFARKKKSLINLSRHRVIENAHPSPLSAQHWFGCQCFSKCNVILQMLGHTPMDWKLPMNPTVEKSIYI